MVLDGGPRLGLPVVDQVSEDVVLNRKESNLILDLVNLVVYLLLLQNQRMVLMLDKAMRLYW